MIRAQASTAVHEQLLAKVLAELGYFLHQNGRYAESETAYKEADELAQKHTLTAIHIACLRGFGINANGQGRWEEARHALEAAYQLCQILGDDDLKLPILNALGAMLTDLAEFEQASAYFAEAMMLAQSLGHGLRIAILYSNMGIIANRQKNYEEAIRQWRLAEAGFAASNYDMGLANTIFNIAMALYGLNRYEEALATIERAYAIHEKLGQRQSLAAGAGVKGMIYHRLGKWSAARRQLHSCLQQAQALGMVGTAVSGLAEMAELEMSLGHLEQAALLLTFIQQHPATRGTTKTNTQRLLEELTAELPDAVMKRVKTAVSTHTLDTLIAQLLRGHEPI
jgi:tetratricopeptide (TPR) repeat protein